MKHSAPLESCSFDIEESEVKHNEFIVNLILNGIKYCTIITNSWSESLWICESWSVLGNSWLNDAVNENLLRKITWYKQN